MKKLFIIILVVFFACTKSPQDNPTLVEANKIHLEAIKIKEDIEGKIKVLDSLKNTINNPAIISKIDSSKKLLESWEESVIEIEGFVHEGHEEHHHHHHKEASKMSDELMLEYQKNTKKAIIELNIEIEKLLKEIEQ